MAAMKRLAPLAAAVLATGCGASGPTRAGFSASAAAVCRTEQRQLESLPKRSNPAKPRPSDLASMRLAHGITLAGLEQLQAVRVPARMQHQVSQVLRSARERLALDSRVIAAVAAKQAAPAAQLISQQHALAAGIARRARAAGLGACSAVLGPSSL